MLQLKEGVVVHGNRYTNKIMETVQFVYRLHGWELVVITSGNDGVHSPNSYHGKDRALDIRFWDVPPEQRRAVADEFRALLPAYYDVEIETDHYHIEADEKKELATS